MRRKEGRVEDVVGRLSRGSMCGEYVGGGGG